MRFFSPFVVLAALMLAGCANKSTTDIPVEDAGQAFKTRYGTVLSHRIVSVRSDSTTALTLGTFGGGIGGAVIGQTNGATLLGFVLGAAAGQAFHDIGETNNGVEYVIAFGDGTTMIIDQIQRFHETLIEPGTRVLVQFGAKSNRVIDAENLPSDISPPRELRIKTPKPKKEIPKNRIDTANKGA